MTDAYENRITNLLSSYLFENVFNQPNFEYRKNIIPQLIKRSASVGRVKLSRTSLSLPTTGTPYHIYMVPTKSLGGIGFSRIDEWVTMVEFLRKTRLELRVHNTDGIMLPRGSVFIRTSPESSNLVIAISEGIMRKLFGSKLDPRDLFVATYFGGANSPGISIDSYIIDANSAISSIFTKAKKANVVFVNGKYTTVLDVTDFNAIGNYVELITDPSIIGTFTIDLANADQRRNFVSLVDGFSKTIIHIPKAMNPDNKIISHSHCDFYLTVRNSEHPNRGGLFFHRGLRGNGFSQITHNDIAIPDKVLNAYTAPLNMYEMMLTVVIKDQHGDNFLIRERNYIDLLYKGNDDGAILDYLEGRPNENSEVFPFWTAATLEASAYSKAIDNTPNANPNVMGDYIDILGYYNTIDLLCNRTHRRTISSNIERVFKVVVPPIWKDPNAVLPVVSVNGVKLADSLITYAGALVHDIIVHIDPSAVLHVNDEVTIELFSKTKDYVTHIVPSAENRRVLLRTSEYAIYRSDVTISPVECIDSVYNLQYEDITNAPDGLYSEVVVNGVPYLEFSVSAFTTSFIVVSLGGYSKAIVDAEPYLASNSPFVFDLEAIADDVVQDRGSVFMLDNHTGLVANTGSVLHPVNLPVTPDRINRQVWHVFSKDPAISSWSRRYAFARDLGPTNFTYKLANAYEGQYLVGYKVGFLCNLSSTEIPRKPTRGELDEIVSDWEILVDSVVVHTISGYTGWGDKSDWATFALPTPLTVTSTITFRAINSRGGVSVAVPYLQYLFDDIDAVRPIPMLGNINTVVHVNNKELVREIDFGVRTILDTEELPVGRKLIVQNVEYLNSTNNVIEIMTTRDVSIERVYGNTFDGILDSLKEDLDGVEYNSTNIALAGTATTSSIEYGKGPGLAINGNINQSLSSGQVAHTQDHIGLDENAWWKVSWLEDKKIAKVNIWSKNPGYQEFNNFVVQILDRNGIVVAEYAHPGTINSDAQISITSFNTVINGVTVGQSLSYYIGRAVRIMLLPESATAHRYLQLSEVEVYEISEAFLFDGLNPLWFDGLSTAIVDGKNLPNISTDFGDVKVPEARVGALFGIRTSFPLAGRKYFTEYYNTYDADLVRRINRYYAERTAIPQGPIPSTTGTHTIYSLYLAAIFKDLLESNDLSITDPDAERLQALTAEYAYLLPLDVASAPGINIVYTDILPTMGWGTDIDITPQQLMVDSVGYNYLVINPEIQLSSSQYLARENKLDLLNDAIVTQSSTPNPLRGAENAVDGNYDAIPGDGLTTLTANHLNPDPKNLTILGTSATGVPVLLIAGRSYTFQYLSGAIRYLAEDSADILRYSGKIEISMFGEKGTTAVLCDCGLVGDPIQVSTALAGTTYTYIPTITGTYNVRFYDGESYADNAGSVSMLMTDQTYPIGRAWWQAKFTAKKAFSTVSITNINDGVNGDGGRLFNFTVFIEGRFGKPLARHVVSGQASVNTPTVITDWELLDSAGVATGVMVEYIEGYSLRIELNPYLGMTARELALAEVDIWESDLYRQWIISRTIKLLGKSQLPNVSMT